MASLGPAHTSAHYPAHYALDHSVHGPMRCNAHIHFPIQGEMQGPGRGPVDRLSRSMCGSALRCTSAPLTAVSAGSPAAGAPAVSAPAAHVTAVSLPGRLRTALCPGHPGLGSPKGLPLRRVTVRSLANDTVTEDTVAADTVTGAAPGAEGVFPEELPKAFDFTAEPKIYEWWEECGFFRPETNDTPEKQDVAPFVVSMPPPNVTGALHMGHAMFVTIEDIMVRFWRMRGRPTLWLPGTDHAGIATQLVVEKMLAKEGLTRTGLGREKFEERVWQWKEQYGGTIGRQIRRLGASCDWSRQRFTLDDQLSKAVLEAFTRLHKKGLIYRGSYMVNWSPSLQTAVSDLEVEYTEETGTLFFFKYPLEGTSGTQDGEYLPVATTRPETLLGDTAVAVNPEDERYKHLVGKFAVVPLSGGRKIPIIADEYVDKEFGTGALKITPGHDINDYALGQKLNLPIINIMNKDGTLNHNAGAYSGLDRFEARQRVWEDLTAQGLGIKDQKHPQRVPRSQRGGEVIEPLVSKQWFVRMEPLAAPALQATRDGTLKIIPERFEKIYNFWLEGIRDWCISRQLWWGHRIPVYYIRTKAPNGAPAATPQAQALSESQLQSQPQSQSQAQSQSQGGSEEELGYVVAASEADALAQVREKYGARADEMFVEQDPDVLDTWFSSGLWPFSTLGWPDEQSPDFKRFYPTTVMETGHDILFFWVARMTMMGLEFTGQLPFSTVYLHGLVRDAQGRKMSKSLGNVVDPLDTIGEYGTDALRFTLATGTTPGQDVNLSMERLGANKAFTNKLWNAGKFILQNLPAKTDAARWESLTAVEFSSPEAVAALPLTERWLVSRLHAVVDECTASYEAFDFGAVGRVAYEFFWSDFADWYIEASKTRLYASAGGSEEGDSEQKQQAQRVLVYAFDTVLRLLHPFMPFVTEQLWQAIPHRGSSLMLAQLPSASQPQDEDALQGFEDIRDLVRSIRNARAEYAVEPARRIAATVVLAAPELAALEAEKAVLCSLARLDPEGLAFQSGAPENAAQSIHLIVTDSLEAFLPLAGLLDVAKEKQRLGKQATKLEAELAGLQKRLSASSFVEKAPKEVVETVKQQAADAEEKLKTINEKLQQLEAMGTEGSQP